MADTEAQSPENLNGVDEIRQQLLRRIAIAGVVIVSLIGALAIFDASYVSDPLPPPVAVAPVVPPPVPETPAAKPEAEPAAEVPPVADSEAAPPEPAKQIAEAPAAPEVTKSPEAPPLREPKQLTKPAVAQPASIKPAPPAIAPAPVASIKPAEALVKASKTPAPPAKPLAQQAAQSDAGRRYLVQMGVFNNVNNAEELHAKLQKAGIPAQIEARVQVGPFASKTEAEAAQKKMAELGLDGGMLVSSRK